jgi:hypothetical protein
MGEERQRPRRGLPEGLRQVGGPTQIAGRSRKSVYARTPRGLLRKLREASWMLAQGLPVSSRNQTLRTFLTSWLEVVRHRIRPSTYDS